MAEINPTNVENQSSAIPWRIYLSLIGTALLVLLMIAFGYYSSLRMVTVYLPQIDASKEAKIAAATAHLWFEEIISGDDNEIISQVWALLDEADELLQSLQDGGEVAQQTIIALDDADLRALAVTAQDQLRRFRTIGEQRLNQDAGVGSDLDQQFDEVFEAYIDTMSSLETTLHQITARDTGGFKITQVVLAIVCLVAFGIIGRILFRFERQRSADIAHLRHLSVDMEALAGRETTLREGLQAIVTHYTTFVQRVTEGDLVARLSMDNNEDFQVDDDLYQLGNNLNTMVASLSDMTGQIREAVAALSAATSEIQAATAQQTASVTEQDVTITQTVATVEEVRTTVQQTAERARQVASSANNSVMTSHSGQNAVSHTIEGMVQIKQQVEKIADNILALSERTKQIGEIIDTVNTIAEQSKLLALNASIEAARAGEEGRGFAVVAMEVRQLAEQSREATARVSAILNEIQQATNAAVMVTEEGSKGAETGLSLVEQAGKAIRELAATIEEAAQSANQIAASTSQQANGMEQLTAAMQHIKQAATQTAASTRQTEQTAQVLMEMAERLENAAARYIV